MIEMQTFHPSAGVVLHFPSPDHSSYSPCFPLTHPCLLIDSSSAFFLTNPFPIDSYLLIHLSPLCTIKTPSSYLVSLKLVLLNPS